MDRAGDGVMVAPWVGEGFPMNHFIQIATGVPVQPLLDELASHPELWDAHTIRKTAQGSPHRRMSDIWVRYNDVTPYEASGDYRTFNDRHVPIRYPAWDALPSVRRIVMPLMAQVQGEMLGGVLITRIPAGGCIDGHTDHGWHAEYYDKFYVSVQNDPGAAFWCEANGVHESIDPEPGEVWHFNNQKLHGVDNKSASDRIAMIVCIRTDLFGRSS